MNAFSGNGIYLPLRGVYSISLANSVGGAQNFKSIVAEEKEFDLMGKRMNRYLFAKRECQVLKIILQQP